MHHTGFTAIVTAAIAGSAVSFASADIVRVSEFDSLLIEGFQGLNMSTFEMNPVETFGGMGTVFNTDGSWVHTTGSWGYKSQVRAFEGARLLGTSSGGVGYSFAAAQKSFGGFFSSISDTLDGEIRFYSGDLLVGTDSVIATNNSSWTWNGWSSNTAFDRVEIRSSDSAAGFLMHDAVRVLSTQVPTPGGGALLMGGLLVLARRKR